MEDKKPLNNSFEAGYQKGFSDALTEKRGEIKLIRKENAEIRQNSICFDTMRIIVESEKNDLLDKLLAWCDGECVRQTSRGETLERLRTELNNLKTHS